MKIAFIISKYGANGVGTYFDNLLKATRKYITEDSDVYVWKNCELVDQDYKNIEALGYKTCERTSEYIELINSYDIVICGYHIRPRKVGPEAATDYIEFFKTDLTHPKKAIVFNEHNFASSVYNYSYDYVVNKEFLLAFDAIMLFGSNTAAASKWKNLIGEDEFMKRFVPLYLLFDMKKNNWVPANEKLKSILYVGRIHKIKHPEMIIPIRQHLDKDWIVECRGMNRGFGVFSIPDLAFKFGPNGKATSEVSPYTRWVNMKFLNKEHNLGINKNSIPLGLANKINDQDKVWIYGPYDLNTVYDILKYAGFCCDFFSLPNPEDYAKQTYEYCQPEFISNGIIPVFNYDFGKNMYLLENAEITNKNFLDIETGLYLKEDLSNIDEFTEKLNYYISNPDKYEEFREKCYQNWKTHTNPEAIIKKLVADIMNK